MNKLVNTLVILGAISLGTLPAQAVNEQLTAEQKAQSQSAQEKIKEVTTSSIFCTAWGCR
jgi:hypothetical protein